MAKRRSVILGLGALATGSGAVITSGAFAGQVTNPSAELQVIADARLLVRAPASPPTKDTASWIDTTAKSPLDSFSDPAFERTKLPTAQIHDTNQNDNYVIRAGVKTGESNTFDSIMEIKNEDGVAHDVGINYGDYDDGSTHGYGSDVDANTWDTGDASAIDRKDVQEMYQFRIPDNADYLPDSTASGQKLLSPDPGDSDDSDKYSETVTVGAGESAYVVLQFDTIGKAGHINNAATGGNPFEAGTYVSLLNSIWVEAI